MSGFGRCWILCVLIGVVLDETHTPFGFIKGGLKEPL